MANISTEKFLEELDETYVKVLELHPERQVKAYISFIIFLLILFGGFGARISFKQLSEANQYKKQLLEMKNSSISKLNSIDTYATQLDQVLPYLNALNKAMPDDPEVQEYLSNFVNEVAYIGYIIETFRVDSTEPQITRLAITLLGDIQDMSRVIAAIESFPRISRVEQIQASFTSRDNKIVLKVVIFNVGKEKITP